MNILTRFPVFGLFLLLAGCIIPDKFQSDIHITHDNVHIQFDGDLIQPLHAVEFAQKGKDPSSKFVMDLRNQIIKELRQIDPNGKIQVQYKGAARFRTSFELNVPKPRRGDRIEILGFLKIHRSREGQPWDIGISTPTVGISNRELQQLTSIGIGVVGKFCISTDQIIHGSNSDFVRGLIVKNHCWNYEAKKRKQIKFSVTFGSPSEITDQPSTDEPVVSKRETPGYCLSYKFDANGQIKILDRQSCKEYKTCIADPEIGEAVCNSQIVRGQGSSGQAINTAISRAEGSIESVDGRTIQYLENIPPNCYYTGKKHPIFCFSTGKFTSDFPYSNYGQSQPDTPIPIVGDMRVCRVQKGGVLKNFEVIDLEACERQELGCKDVNGERSCIINYVWPSGGITVVEYRDEYYAIPFRVNGHRAFSPNAIADHNCVLNTSSENILCVSNDWFDIEIPK